MVKASERKEIDREEDRALDSRYLALCSKEAPDERGHEDKRAESDVTHIFIDCEWPDAGANADNK